MKKIMPKFTFALILFSIIMEVLRSIFRNTVSLQITNNKYNLFFHQILTQNNTYLYITLLIAIIITSIILIHSNKTKQTIIKDFIEYTINRNKIDTKNEDIKTQIEEIRKNAYDLKNHTNLEIKRYIYKQMTPIIHKVSITQNELDSNIINVIDTYITNSIAQNNINIEDFSEQIEAIRQNVYGYSDQLFNEYIAESINLQANTKEIEQLAKAMWLKVETYIESEITK